MEGVDVLSWSVGVTVGVINGASKQPLRGMHAMVTGAPPMQGMATGASSLVSIELEAWVARYSLGCLGPHDPLSARLKAARRMATSELGVVHAATGALRWSDEALSVSWHANV